MGSKHNGNNHSGKGNAGQMQGNQSGHADPQQAKQEENGAGQAGQRGHGTKGTGESGTRAHPTGQPEANHAVKQHAEHHTHEQKKDPAPVLDAKDHEGKGNVGHSGKTAAQHRQDGQHQDDQRLAPNEPAKDAQSTDETQPGQGGPNRTGKDDGEFAGKAATAAVLPKHA
jgi:hypothetical protein